MSKFELKPSSDDKVFTVHDEIRIVLLGKTGAGKSTTGNAIVGEKAFKAKASGKSVTQECDFTSAIRGDKKIILVDTPGLFDTSISVDETKKELGKCVTISSPGVHCFLVIIDASRRFTEEEANTISHILHMFGENSHRYLIVLFTRIDQLEEDLNDEENFREYLNDIPEDLEKFLQTCDNRCLGINNRAASETKEVQVVKLLNMIEKMIRKNGGNCYTSEIYEQTERKIQDEIKQAKEKQIRQEKEVMEQLKQKIGTEMDGKLKQDLEEEKEKLEKQYKENGEKREEEIRSQIREEARKNKRSTFGRVVDFAVDVIVDIWNKWKP